MKSHRMLVTGEAEVFFVYSDDPRMRRVMQRLGSFDVHRISDVEFNPATGKWEAVLRNGVKVAEGESRDVVVSEEIRYISDHLSDVRPYHGS